MNEILREVLENDNFYKVLLQQKMKRGENISLYIENLVSQKLGELLDMAPDNILVPFLKAIVGQINYQELAKSIPLKPISLDFIFYEVDQYYGEDE